MRKYSWRKKVPQFPTKSIRKQSSPYKNDCWQIICICPILLYFQHEQKYYFQFVCVRACVVHTSKQFLFVRWYVFPNHAFIVLSLKKVCLFNRNICSTHSVFKSVFLKFKKIEILDSTDYMLTKLCICANTKRDLMLKMLLEFKIL